MTHSTPLRWLRLWPARPTPVRREAATAPSSTRGFALRPDRYARLPFEADTDTGYFFCSHSLAVAAGTYVCAVTASMDAHAAVHSHLEVVAWRAGAGEMIAQASWQPSAEAPGIWVAKVPFQLERYASIELRGYAGGRLPQARLLGGVIDRNDGDAASFISDDPWGWPVRQLKWVVIGTTGVCNASCAGCPTNKDVTAHLPKRHMAWPVFQRLIDGIADAGLDITGHISFGLFGDALIDPQVVKRARYVKQKLPGVRLMLVTNGGVATTILAQQLQPYVDAYAFHVEALDAELYNELMHPLRAERVFPRIENFIAHCGRPVIISVPVNKRNVDQIGPLTDYWMQRGAERVSPALMNNRCTNDLNFGELAIASTPGQCPGEIASNLIVDADGSVLGCCEDFQLRNIIGNLQLETVEEALGNAARRQLFEDLQAGRWGELASCSQCRLGDATVMERILASAAAENDTAALMPT